MTKAEELADKITEHALDRKVFFGEGQTADLLNQAAALLREQDKALMVEHDLAYSKGIMAGLKAIDDAHKATRLKSSAERMRKDALAARRARGE